MKKAFVVNMLKEKKWIVTELGDTLAYIDAPTDMLRLKSLYLTEEEGGRG